MNGCFEICLQNRFYRVAFLANVKPRLGVSQDGQRISWLRRNLCYAFAFFSCYQTNQSTDKLVGFCEITTKLRGLTQHYLFLFNHLEGLALNLTQLLTFRYLVFYLGPLTGLENVEHALSSCYTLSQMYVCMHK